VFRALLWWITGNLRKATRWASVVGRAVAWALMAWGVMNMMGGALVQGLWLLLIGWFLSNAARMSYQQLVIREGLRDVPVARIMRTRLASVAPDTTVDRFVHEELMAGDQRAFPVIAPGEGLLGLVCLEDVRKVPRAAWAERTIAEIMTPADRLAVVTPGAPAEEALRTLEARRVDQLPVVDGDRLVGLVRRQDVLTWLSLNRDDDDEREAAGTPRAAHG
jgi:CBS domain-containing protein